MRCPGHLFVWCALMFLAQELQAGKRSNLLRDVRSTESAPVSALCCFCGCPSRILLDEGLLEVTGLVVHPLSTGIDSYASITTH